ncbi:autotransporter domain-containing protein [Allorhizobium borbori]|uniref:T5SS/PEP-CTERM-associated repeat protein/autotransporter-associated beta strand protein n=1 Tax=Allorhizobium borbori TaxID=485907 RepID=A0A7W6K047_9HYPH|nr:autotransporter domain-containing protein [Allorhizobium borbori]MBB4101675.1 T5SS/PEP-CTERM-associated repeat protein/autotransporter-associated beta strand protein [Allorhizobium borbori]
MPRLSRDPGAMRRLLACTTALSLLLPALASAADLRYADTGNWWFDPNNWIGTAVPGATDTATIDGALEALIVNDQAKTGTLYVGRNADGALLVRDPLATQTATIGAQVGIAGTVTVSGTIGAWKSEGDVIVADRGTGTLNVMQGASAAFDTMRLGNATGGSGTLLVNGNGSGLTIDTALDAGYAGTGSVTVSSGARLTAGNARFGTLSGADGSLTVDREGSTFDSTSLILGDAGSGRLDVLAGGSATVAGNTVLGAQAGSDGSTIIRGDGSRLAVGGTLTVGESGTGAVTVSEGADAASLDAVIGVAAGSSATVQLSGLGTHLAVTRHLDIGTGSLIVDTAAALSTGSATIGTLAGETATATLSGSGTTWDTTGTLAVGDTGDGRLNVLTGADVSAQNLVAGDTASGTGEIRADGNGSSLSVAQTFDIGRLGQATLDVVAGAKASAGFVRAGTEQSGSGAVHVDGDGSRLDVSGDFDIGRFGNGTLTVSGGAAVAARSITIAREAGSTGTLNIGAEETALAAGAGTVETASIHFGEGNGTLVLNHGETDYELSAVLSGTGTVKVLRGTTILTGDNSHDGETHIDSGATLAIGNGGTTGTLGSGDVLNDGALVFNRSGEIAFSGDISGTGTLTKTGDGTLTLSGQSTYGGATTVANGRLDVDGSLNSSVSVAGGATLGGDGTVGTTTIAGSGTLLAEGLHVAGDLSLASGATLAARIRRDGLDSVTIDGIATLGDANLTLSFDKAAVLANHYTILEAGSLAGDFATVSLTGLSSRFSAAGANDATTAGLDLRYDGSSASLSGRAANGVHTALGNAFNTGTTLSGSLSTALMSDGADFQNAMTALTGETGTSARILGLLTLEDFLRSASDAGSAFADGEKGADLWARMTGQGFTFNADRSAGIGAATASLAGIEGGARLAIDPVWSAGLALSFGQGRYNSDDTSASATGRYVQAALHVAGHFGNGAYVSAALGTGLVTTDTRRNPGGGDRVEGSFTSRTAGVDLEAGQRIDFDDFALTPFAGVSLIHSRAPGYAETVIAGSGNPALAYRGLDQWAGTIRVGLDTAYATAIDDHVLSLYTRLAYLHHFASDGGTGASFVALPGSYFDLQSATREGGAVTASVGARYTLGPRTDLTLDLGGAWNQKSTQFTGKLGFNLKW